MIPQRLTLHNFLSYREASLDFRGLHTACICGPNGSGKSSLLEAITWALWGQSRAAADDDIIHAGTSEARVDLEFACDRNLYRVIRSKRRGNSSTLDLQVQTAPETFRSLSGRGVRATQQKLDALLRIDYDTFVNSAYLRQGRADEFMLRRPGERKQILADLLKLDRYEDLSGRAKDLAKQFKAEAEQIEHGLRPLAEQLERRDAIANERDATLARIQQLRDAQERDRQRLHELQTRDRDLHSRQQQLAWQHTQLEALEQECDRLRDDRHNLHRELAQLQQVLAREADIQRGYRTYQHLQQQQTHFARAFQGYQRAQQHLQHLRHQRSEQLADLQLQAQAVSSQLEGLNAQEQENRDALARRDEVARALVDLRAARDRLQQLDRLQHQAAPLLQRRQELQVSAERARARLSARLEQLHATAEQLSVQVEQAPHVRSQVVAVETELNALAEKQDYHRRLVEKGQERRSFQERLQESQRNCDKQIVELSQKLDLLQTPDASCPLCDRPLDTHYKQHVVEKTRAQQQELRDRFAVLREQLATCERELQVLRAEYKDVTAQLQPFQTLLQQRGQLSARLESTDNVRDRLDQLAAESAEVEQALAAGTYARDVQNELERLDAELVELDYSEESHAIARGEVERWRWAEVKQARIEDAVRRQNQIERQRPHLQQQLQQIKHAAKQLQTDSELARQIAAAEAHLAELNYDGDRHSATVAALQEAQPWESRFQQLQQARQTYPPRARRYEQLDTTLRTRETERDRLRTQIEHAQTQLQGLDNREAISALEVQMQARRRELDEAIATRGKLDQSLVHLEGVQERADAAREHLHVARHQFRVYNELAQAFGKNGIQALTIETILPQLEAQTNYILSRLTGNQLHVQFVTQKAGKGRSKKAPKYIDTLEIRIADARGTRPYETYSGGEGFRINFSIRLALAKLLAQHAGMALQILVIDEGFGTQDAEGCDRLIAAIDAIAADFACILTVTHMPQFKAAFQNRIEISKTETGSQIGISS